jgi:hypothetical protein
MKLLYTIISFAIPIFAGTVGGYAVVYPTRFVENNTNFPNDTEWLAQIIGILLLILSIFLLMIITLLFL